MLQNANSPETPLGGSRQVRRPMFGHLAPADLLQDFPQLGGMQERLLRHRSVESTLVELVRAQDLDIYLHTAERLLERRQKMFGVGGVTPLGVRDPREAVADVTLVLPGHTGSYLAQRVYSVRMEHKAHFHLAGLEGVRDRFSD